MDKLKWIESTGGPLIMITDKSFPLWSGTLKRTSYLANKFEEADDFMDPDETDYGKACEVQDYLGEVDIGNEFALVLGDEPLLTTALKTRDGSFILARWIYADDSLFVENTLKVLEIDKINHWELGLTFSISSDIQYLFDSASNSRLLSEGEEKLLLNIAKGSYEIWTSVYEPNAKTKLLIHRFDRIN